MNRREIRKMKKKTGISNYVKSLPRSEQFERIRQNIIDGKKKQEEMKEVVRLQNQVNDDKTINNKISSMATQLMVSEGLDYIDAIEKSKEHYK